MAVIKFPKPYKEPPPPAPEREQLEPWDLPEPPKRDTRKALLAEIADELAAAVEHLDAARVGLALLEEGES
jgi:hypothetical protein